MKLSESLPKSNGSTYSTPLFFTGILIIDPIRHRKRTKRVIPGGRPSSRKLKVAIPKNPSTNKIGKNKINNRKTRHPIGKKNITSPFYSFPYLQNLFTT